MTKSGKDRRLKLAIVASGETQRKIATDTGIGEVRLSEIVCGRGGAPTQAEKQSLAKRLRRPLEQLFTKAAAAASASA